MRFQVIGCGDAFSSGGRFNTCFLVDASSTRFLIDCGASSLVALNRFGVDPDTIDAVLITHLHGDHFGGLVFILRQATLYGRRTRPLLIAGPPGLRDRLETALEAFFPGGASVPTTFKLEVVELEDREPLEIASLRVTAFTVSHPCGAPPYALRVEIDGKVIAYTADTAWVDAVADAGRDADLFICEAYSLSEPFRSHLDLATVKRHLPEIRPKRVLLTHLGEEMLANLDTVDLDVAEDGQVITL